MPAGHKSGQPGFSWGDLVATLVDEHGTLTAVAWKLLDARDGIDDVASVERALRRLRDRGQRDGGVWGQRLLRRFGVPAGVVARVRWMGLYHSPFTDLPVSLCRDQLRVWDRPPVAESRARAWLALGTASCALRQRRHDEAAQACDAAETALRTGDDESARLELLLVRAFLVSRQPGEREDEIGQLLDGAEALVATAQLDAGDAACFRARLVNQRAHRLNRTRHADAEAEALELYEALPRDDAHPFASYRRDAGLAWGCFRAGRTDEALALAARACRHAGDGGYTRLRAMGLLLHAKIAGPPASHALVERAQAIATRLEDDELARRVQRLRS